MTRVKKLSAKDASNDLAAYAAQPLADLFIRLHPKMAGEMLSTVEAWANGQR